MFYITKHELQLDKRMQEKIFKQLRLIPGKEKIYAVHVLVAEKPEYKKKKPKDPK